MCLTGRALLYGKRVKACQQCGAATKHHEPKALRKARQPLNWKRTAAKAAGDVDPDTWQCIVVFYSGRCCHCEETPWEEQDHFQAIAKGGQHVPANVGPACRRCNQRKGRQTWYPRRPHPFMVQADVAARQEALADSFNQAPFKGASNERN